MKGISSFAIIILFVCLAMIGLAFLPMLPVKLVSSNTLPSLSVNYSMGQMSARVVEMEVTSKLEGVLNRVTDVKRVSSSSRTGGGSVTLELDRHANIDVARFEVSSLIRQVWPEFPSGVSYPSISTSRPDRRSNDALMMFQLMGPGMNSELQHYAEEKLTPLFTRFKEIDKVTVEGSTPMEWVLEYNVDHLNSLGVSPNDIYQALSSFSVSSFVGMNIKIVPGEEMVDSIELARVVVKKIDDKIITLDQLVKMKHQNRVPYNYKRINGQNVLLLTLYASEEANQIDLADKMYQLTQEINAMMPDDYLLEMTYDGTKYIRKELNKIYFRTGLTVLILLLFVLLVSRSGKYLALICCTLSVNIAIAFLFYYFSKVEIELYSLAGITLSLGLVIDNIIIMTDHLLRKRDLKVFLAVLAATLTTVASLSVIFFMDERIRVMLQGFAQVIIINLLLSLVVVLFLVPALVDRMRFVSPKLARSSMKRLRRKVKLNQWYDRTLSRIYYHKKIVSFMLILLFGIPFYMLPERMVNEKWWTSEPLPEWKKVYNATLGSAFYREHVRIPLGIFLGGTLKLFLQGSASNSYFVDRGETKLSVYASLPNGATLEQMDVIIREFEEFLLSYDQISQFETNVRSGQQASVDVLFKDEYQKGYFPKFLMDESISRVMKLGGATWQVLGVGDGFDNKIKESNGNSCIKLLGYNYDHLLEIGEEVKMKLETFKRVKNVSINSQYTPYKADYSEMYFRFNKEEMVRQGIEPSYLFSRLNQSVGRDQSIGTIGVKGKGEEIRLVSDQLRKIDVWNLKERGQTVNKKEVRLTNVAQISREQTPQNISKENQQYVLYVQFQYLGDGSQLSITRKKVLEDIIPRMPMGYSVANMDYYGSYSSQQSNRQYLLLIPVFIIIYFLCSILFNSLRQPLAVIYTIPLSYVGIFLTFWFFKLNFDQGGFASFVLLGGITVNASLYILNDFNNIRRRYPGRSISSAFRKAFNGKIIPILLTVVSTALGFLPFMLGDVREAFWFALSAGIIGGLCFSLVAIVFFLPLFVGVGGDYQIMYQKHLVRQKRVVTLAWLRWWRKRRKLKK